MTLVEELVVRAKPDGIDETTDQLDSMEDEFGDTADEMDRTAGQMEGLATQWQGAMTAILSGLAIAAGGLLSQVPVIGELMSGLGAIIEAVAFQIDQLLRPVITPLTDTLFDLSAAIFELEGTAADIVGVIGLWGAAVLGATAGAIGWLVATEGLIGTLSLLGGMLLSALTNIGAFITGTVAGATLLGIAIGAVVVKFLDMIGVLAMVNSIGQRVGSLFGEDVTDAFLVLGTVLSLGLLPIIAALGAALVQLLRGDIPGAVNAFMQVINMFGSAFVDTFKRILGFIQDIISGIGEAGGALQQLPGVSSPAPNTGGGGGATSGGGGGNNNNQGFFGGLLDQTTQLFVDGREVEKGTRRHRDRETNRRGRFG
jgi:hypothetical protein